MLALAHPIQPDYASSSSSSSTGTSSASSNLAPSRSNSSSRNSATTRKHSSSYSTTTTSSIQPPLAAHTHSRAASSSSSTTSAPTKQPTIDQSSSLPFTPHHRPVDIHTFPPTDLLRLLASLLTQIAAANDTLSPQSMRHDIPLFDHSLSPIWKTLTTASKSALGNPSASLSFHARNIPTISLESYLLRILKYCPTTNEVFLSLLVYFDRMAKMSNAVHGRQFIIDSYNIHRLVIAGVTVASKFFSDVFYTNSRYAKVGGLPQAELNQLELQFLLLNDFGLRISPDELQRYAEQLVVFSESRSGPSIPPMKPSTSMTAPMAAGMGAVEGLSSPTHSHPPTSSEMDISPSPTTHIQSQLQALKNGTSTPLVRPRQASCASFTSMSSDADSYDVSDAETASETGTETDFDGSTDDEPTIRPNHASCSSDTFSVYSFATNSESGDGELVDGNVNEQ